MLKVKKLVTMKWAKKDKTNTSRAVTGIDRSGQKKIWILFSISTIVALVLIGGTYYYFQNRDTNDAPPPASEFRENAWESDASQVVPASPDQQDLEPQPPQDNFPTEGRLNE